MPNYRVIGRPFKGRAVGEAIRLTHVEGRALVAMKRVKIDDGRSEMQSKDPASGESFPATSPAPTAKKATKRAYRRRDMQAED